MNVLIEDESKKNKRLKIFYIGILVEMYQNCHN